MTRRQGLYGYGRRQRAILEFLDQKARDSQPSDFTGEAYVSVTEIARFIGRSTHDVVLAMQHLRKRGLVRIFPSKRAKPIFYGSTNLPEIDMEALNKGRIAFGLDPL